MTRPNAIDVQYPYIIRGTNQGTDTGLLWQPPSYKAWGQGTLGATTLRYPGAVLDYFALHNRSGSSIVMGIGIRIPDYYWRAGSWTNLTTTYADDTTDAQDAGADDFVLDNTTTNDGYVILSRVPFNAVSINVGTADTGTAPVRAVRFSNAAGTAWQTAESQIFVQSGALVAYITGEQVVVFSPPVDWGKSVSLATNLPDGYYAMNVRSTTAPGTTGATANRIEIFRFYFLTEAVADNATLLEEFSSRGFLMAQDNMSGGTQEVYGDGVVALFGTANDGNRVTLQCRSAV